MIFTCMWDSQVVDSRADTTMRMENDDGDTSDTLDGSRGRE